MKEYRVTIKYTEFFSTNVDAENTEEAGKIALESNYRDYPAEHEDSEIENIERIE